MGFRLLIRPGQGFTESRRFLRMVDMPQYSSYIICGTPRSGSTLLCEMLAATGVSGRPNSYFRQQSIAHWAERWSLDQTNGTDGAEFDRRYLSAMLDYGRNDTGIFGLRIMWASVADAAARLGTVYGEADIAALFEKAFGSVLYIHLSRRDTVAQAISRLRAEQSGLWHLAADGSVFEGTATPRPSVYDTDRIAGFVSELESDNAAWSDFFRTRQIEPISLTYETMTADPQSALRSVLEALDRDPEIAATVSVGTAKMADGESRQWAERFRAEYGGNA